MQGWGRRDQRSTTEPFLWGTQTLQYTFPFSTPPLSPPIFPSKLFTLVSKLLSTLALSHFFSSSLSFPSLRKWKMKRKGAGAETVVQVLWPNPLSQMAEAGAAGRAKPSSCWKPLLPCSWQDSHSSDWIVVGSDSPVAGRDQARWCD